MSLRARRLTQPATVSAFDFTSQPAHPGASPNVLPDAAEPAAQAAPVTPEFDHHAHQVKLASLEREAFAKGFEQGERAGAEAARERGEAMLRRLTQTLEELTTLRAEMIRQTERQMVQLALAIARRILHREVSLDQDLLIAMARVALDRLGESAQVTVRLHPEEFEATAAARAAEWTGTTVQVVADARVGRGGCRVESDFGMSDAGVDAQLQELARALLGDEEGSPNVPSGR
jgi:flagellar assembly protein FliH